MTWENRLTFEVLSDVRNANPYFETTASPWTSFGGTAARSTAQFHQGGAALLLTPDGIQAFPDARSELVPGVTAGAAYQAQAWVRCVSSRNVSINILWRNAGGAVISTSNAAVAVTAATWTLLTVSATAPALTTQAQVTVSMASTPPVTDLLYVDEAILTNVDDSGGVWNNLTTRIRDLIQPVTTSVGRQNDLNQSEPGRLDLLLDNADDALTYGNTASPYALWWGPGRKCRLRELVNGVTTTRFTGYLQVPTESLITAGIEQRVSITAVDRLGRLASSEPFVSTLGEHIKYAGGTNLVGYWPCGGGLPPFANVKTGPPIRLQPGGYFSVGVTTTSGAATVTAGSSTVPADDLALPNYGVGIGQSAGVDVITRALSLVVSESTGAWRANAGQPITVVVWLNPNYPTDASASNPLQIFTQLGIITLRPTSAGSYFLNCLTGMTGSLTNGAVRNSQWQPMAIRYDFTASSMEFWLGTDRYTVALAGSVPSVETVTDIYAPAGFAGAFGHVQLYIGAWGRTEFLAQQQMGLTGLERQTTGDRIRTIAQYAGVPAAELAQVDKGQSVMQPARLAGKDPLTAMREAERTEQGLLYADGSGNLVFEDRSSLYNI